MSDEIVAEAVEAPEENVELSEEYSEEESYEAEAEEGEESYEASEEGAETVEELQDQIEDAIEDGASEEEIEDMIREFELKVNGKTVKKTIDLSDEDAIRRELQMSAAGRQSMQELAEIKKLYTNELNRLKDNPWDVLEELGLNSEELAESLLRQKIAEAEKSPEQREREQMQRELEEARRELQRQKEEAELARMTQLEHEAAAELETEIEEALSSHETLPRSQKTIARIADTMLWAMENGYPDVTVKDVIPTVEDEIRKELQEFMSQLPDQMFDQYLGKKNMERLRQRRLNDLKKQPKKEKLKATTQSLKNTEDKPKKKMRAKDFFKNLG